MRNLKPRTRNRSKAIPTSNVVPCSTPMQISIHIIHAKSQDILYWTAAARGKEHPWSSAFSPANTPTLLRIPLKYKLDTFPKCIRKITRWFVYDPLLGGFVLLVRSFVRLTFRVVQSHAMGCTNALLISHRGNTPLSFALIFNYTMYDSDRFKTLKFKTFFFICIHIKTMYFAMAKTERFPVEPRERLCILQTNRLYAK